MPTWAGFLFLAVVLDVWSRRVVGWSMRKHLRTEPFGPPSSVTLANGLTETRAYDRRYVPTGISVGSLLDQR